MHFEPGDRRLRCWFVAFTGCTDVELTTGMPSQHRLPGNRRGGSFMDHKRFARTTNSRVLSRLEVTAADVPYASLKDMLLTLALQSGEGLWMNPFRASRIQASAPRSISSIWTRIAGLPTGRVVPDISHHPIEPQPPASWRCPPTRSIRPDQTGDQLMLCPADEWSAASKDSPVPASPEPCKARCS